MLIRLGSASETRVAPGDALEEPSSGPGEQARWRRLAGISASLVGTNAVTSILGLGFWTVAARTLTPAAVGVAGAAVALMMLVGAFSTLGLGTLLISRLPAEPPERHRRLVRSCLCVAGCVAGMISLLSVWPAIELLGTDHLRPVVATPATVFGFAAATALTAATMVLDQAVLVRGVGTLQLERNLVASIVKIAALVALTSAGAHDGMTVVTAWTVGNIASLLLVAYRTRSGRQAEEAGPLIDLQVLRGLGHEALSHHALNLSLQLPLQLLPVLVTVMLSARDNGYFSTALLVTGFVFTLPFAVSIALFAAAEGDEHEVRHRLRWTIPFGLAVSLAADVLLYPMAGLVLGMFGHGYAVEATTILRVLVLAGLPFVIKDHFVALRRVQHRTGQAATIIVVFSLAELAAAAGGAHWGGVLGLCWAWVAVTFLEATALAAPLLSGSRALNSRIPTGSPTTLPLGVPLGPPAPDPPRPRPPASPGSPPPVRHHEAPAPGPAHDPSLLPAGRHATWPAVPRHERDLLAVTLTLMSAGLAVAAIAAACARTRSPNSWLEVLYAVGLAMVFLPAAVRVLYVSTAPRERVALGMALPLLLQLIRFVLHPSGFAYHDELVHQNTLRLITETHHLFHENPLLPVSSYYPGLEIATHAVSSLTGLSPLASSGVVLLLARLVITAALMALITSLTHSVRVATVASVLYTCNPQLIFFNSQFSYQTLALPLAVLSAYLLASAGNRFTVPSLLGCGAALTAVAVTHHLTSTLLIAALVAWTGLELAFGRHRRMYGQAKILGAATGFGLAAVVMVAANSGNPVGGYLLAIARNSRSALASFQSGGTDKALFVDPAGSSSQPWEHVLMVYAVVIVGLVLALALLRNGDWWKRRVAPALILVLLATSYPIIPLGHVTRATAEVGDRVSGFAFLGVAFVLAWAVHDLPIVRRWAVLGGLVAAGVFVGNAILGAGPIGTQLPGPYEVSADARSLDVHNLATAKWIAHNLPSGSRVYADRDSGLLAAAIGGQFTVRHVSTGIDASRLLLDPRFTREDLAVARAAQIAYLIVDRRDATSLPHLGVYVEDGEFGQDARTRPVPLAALTKMDGVTGVQRIYDDGFLVIYDIRRISSAHPKA